VGKLVGHNVNKFHPSKSKDCNAETFVHA